MGAWKTWFAWHPVTLTNGRRAWLETVQRQGEWLGMQCEVTLWTYRELATDHQGSK